MSVSMSRFTDKGIVKVCINTVLNENKLKTGTSILMVDKDQVRLKSLNISIQFGGPLSAYECYIDIERRMILKENTVVENEDYNKIPWSISTHGKSEFDDKQSTHINTTKYKDSDMLLILITEKDSDDDPHAAVFLNPEIYDEYDIFKDMDFSITVELEYYYKEI